MRATARPIPPDAPVTIAARPLRMGAIQPRARPRVVPVLGPGAAGRAAPGAPLASRPMARLLLSLLAAAVALASCGSDDDGGAAPAPPQPPAAAPADFPSAKGKTLNELL